MLPVAHHEVARRSRARGLLARLVIAAALWLSIAAPASGHETSWQQFQGDSARSGATDHGPLPPFLQAWPSSFKVAAEMELGLSAPILAGDVAVTVGPRAVYGVDVATGTQVWMIDRKFGPSVPAAVATDPGGRQILVYTEGFGDDPQPVSDAAARASAAGTPQPEPTTPTPSTAEPVFTGEQQPRVVAVDLATREPIWDRPFDLMEVSRTGVTIDGSSIFVGDNLGNVYAISLETGEALWSEPYAAPGTLTSALAAGEGFVVVAAQARIDPDASTAADQPTSAVVAIDTFTGEAAWTYTVENRGYPTTSPAIGDSRVYFGVIDGEAIALELATGKQLWSDRLGGVFLPTSSPVVASGGVFMVDAQSGHAFRLDADSGDQVWDFALNLSLGRGVPVLAGPNLLVTSVSGQLSAIDVETGRLAYRGAPVGGLLGPMAVADRSVIAVRGGKNAGLIAFAADPEGALLDVPSPTTLDVARLLSGFLIALVGLTLVLTLLGRTLLARIGPPAFETEDDFIEDEEEG